jgi:hypothetical protein
MRRANNACFVTTLLRLLRQYLRETHLVALWTRANQIVVCALWLSYRLFALKALPQALRDSIYLKSRPK